MSRNVHRRSRAVRVAAGALVLSAMGLASSLPASGQEAPVDAPKEAVLLQYGWWNKAQQSPAGGSPVPRPPGAPEDGIFIAYEPTAGPAPTPIAGVTGIVATAPSAAPKPLGPDAFGAVRYSVPEGAEADLTLHYIPTSTSTPGGASADVGELFACPVSSAWDPVQNGRYDGAPKYNCANGVKGTYAGDSISFTLPAALSTGGMFDLALVPQGTQPFKVSVKPPDSASMVLTSVPESELSSSEDSFDASTFEDPAAAFDESFGDESVGVDDLGGASASDFAADDFSAGSFSSSAGGAGRAAVAGARSRSVGNQVGVPAGIISNPFRADASRAERMMAVALLLALAVGLWWVGGMPIRAPRLLGSLGAGIPVEAAEVNTGGIGRFVRVRPATRPPRLF